MSNSERMSPVDTWWLRMDRPHNLMTIVAVWILEGPVALDRLENQLFERHLTYRRYRQKVEFALVDGPVGTRRAAPPDEDEGWLQTLMTQVVAAISVGTQGSTSTLGTALGLARNPLRAVDYLRHGAGVAGELAYLLSMKSDSATRFKGKPTGSKCVAWCEPLKLPEVKAVSRALGCSINDVLLSCAAGAMRRYLADKGDRTEGVQIRALAPIDLREPGDLKLGNRFGIVAVLLPVGVEHPLERLMMVRQRMLDLKTSYEPAVTLGVFAALGYLPKIVQDQLFDLVASRATAVMTNVPGPSEPLMVAGSRIRQMLFWVPQSGDIGMGVSILSYAGQVQFGLIADAALTPDPEAVVSRFPEEFEAYLYHLLLDPPPLEEEPAAGETASRPRLPARGEKESA